MSKPTIREILIRVKDYDDSSEEAIDELAERVEAVLKLHVEEYHQDAGPICVCCSDDWPCPTVRALNGEKV